MYNNKVLSTSLATLLSLFCSVAMAGQIQNPNNGGSQGSCSGGGGGGGGGGSACATLTIGGKTSSGTASDFNTKVMQQKPYYFPTSTFGNATSSFKFQYGTLNVSNLAAKSDAIVTFTYLGSDALYTDFFGTKNTPMIFDNKTSTVGASFTETVTKNGILDFEFSTLQPSYIVTNAANRNGTANYGYGAGEGVFGILDKTGGYKINGVTYADLLIYNDPVKNGDHDFNDLVVGVNIYCPPVSPVPEPLSYAMMLSGLGLIGVISYRRKNDSSNMPMAV